MDEELWGLGIPEEEFHHHRGMITKAEVRAIVLAKMRLQPHSIVWDIGAGAGSVAIEAARLAPQGRVFAMERDPQAREDILLNMQKFEVSNLTLVAATAPKGLEMLPSPHAVFVGGSGGHLKAILEVAVSRLKQRGRLVMNAVSLESLSLALDFLKRQGWPMETLMVNIARSRNLAGLTGLEPLNPVFIVTAWAPEQETHG